MELIFKKYHESGFSTEKTYLIYDPAHNKMQLTQDLCKSISHRNFGQCYENILVGPIIKDKKITVRVLGPDGAELSSDAGTEKIFKTYLHDQGYLPAVSAEHNISASGTVYYYPA